MEGSYFTGKGVTVARARRPAARGAARTDMLAQVALRLKSRRRKPSANSTAK